jgi:putative ABC transport system permease protein
MSFGQHVRIATRQWARQSRLAATAVVTLALGIGGATTMFAFLQAFARLGQPTVPQSEQIGRLFTARMHESEGRDQASFVDFCRWQDTARSFEALAAYKGDSKLLRTAEGSDEVGVQAVTPGYFALLRMPPVIGRFFNEQESRGSGVAILGEKVWRSRFGADPGVLGRTLDLDGQTHTVIGVAAERLGLGTGGTTAFVPFDPVNRDVSVMVIGRRRSTTTWEQVGAEMAAIGAGNAKTQVRVRVVPILEDASYRTRMGWLMFVGPPALVLLIGCGNVASLLLVRAVHREREMATRLALGASRPQVAALLLTEGWILAVTGGALGVVLAMVGLRGVQAAIPPALDLRLGVDAGVWLFVAAATFLTPLVFGAAPLLHSLRLDLTGALRAGLRKPLFGLKQYHLRDVFVILEVGLAVGLLTFTFMLLSLFAAVRQIDFNFNAEGLIVARVAAPEPGALDGKGDVDAGLPSLLKERLSAVPGVRQTTVGDLPLGHAGVRVSRSSAGLEIVAREVRADGSYFETLRLPIVRGRGIDASDARGTAVVGVVSEGLAARLWPQEDPLGQVLRVAGAGRAESVTIVGVVRDALRLGRLQYLQVSEVDNSRYALYRPWSQGTWHVSSIIARAHGKPASLFGRLQEAVQAADPRLRIQKVESVRSIMGIRKGEEGQTLIVSLLLGFGGLALLLAIIGVFGVMRQLVDERQAELGVRLALGASPGNLVRSIVEDGLIRVGVGAGLAIVFVSVSTRLAFSGLLSVSAADPWLWLAILTAVASTAAAACYLPARRAAKVDPMVALRCE